MFGFSTADMNITGSMGTLFASKPKDEETSTSSLPPVGQATLRAFNSDSDDDEDDASSCEPASHEEEDDDDALKKAFSAPDPITTAPLFTSMDPSTWKYPTTESMDPLNVRNMDMSSHMSTLDPLNVRNMNMSMDVTGIDIGNMFQVSNALSDPQGGPGEADELSPTSEVLRDEMLQAYQDHLVKSEDQINTLRIKVAELEASNAQLAHAFQLEAGKMSVEASQLGTGSRGPSPEGVSPPRDSPPRDSLAEEQISRLSTTIADLEAKNIQLQAERQASEVANKGMAEQLSTALAQLEENERMLQHLRQEYKEKEQTIQLWRQDATEKQQAIDELTANLAQKDQTIQDLQQAAHALAQAEHDAREMASSRDRAASMSGAPMAARGFGGSSGMRAKMGSLFKGKRESVDIEEYQKLKQMLEEALAENISLKSKGVDL